MKVIHKKVIGFSLLVISAIAGVLLYAYYKQPPASVSDLYKIVPIDATYFIQSKNSLSGYQQMLNNNRVWQLFSDLSSVKELNEQVLYFDSLFSSNPNLKNNAVDELIISCHPTGKNRSNFLFIAKPNLPLSSDQVLELITNEIQGKASQVEREYENTTIYEIVFNKKERFSWVYLNGVFIASKSSILVEEAVRQLLSSVNLSTDHEFKRVFSTAGRNVDANIYVNYKDLPGVFRTALSKKLQRRLGTFTNFASWSELDVHVKPDMIMLNGFCTAPDSTPYYINCLKTQEGCRFNFPEVVPSQTAAFIALGISDWPSYLRNFDAFLENNQNINRKEKYLNQVKEKFHTDLSEVFSENFDEEVLLVFLEKDNMQDSPFADNFAFIRLKSQSQAEDDFRRMLTNYIENNPTFKDSMVTACRIDAETVFPVYRYPAENPLPWFFGSVFEEVDARYFTFYENYLIFGPSIKSLQQVLHMNIIHKTLANEPGFVAFMENLDNRSNLLMYMDVFRFKDQLSYYFSEATNKNLDANAETFRNLDALAFQLTGNNNMLYSNAVLRYTSTVKEKTHTLWESRLDTTMHFKPIFVVNHTNNKKEVFIQDDKFNIYLINEAGRVLWKKCINEAIISDVTQVDIYKNNKLQYAFNTKNYLFILDRNGNNVENFPIKLSAPATNGLAIFDYEESRDYRFFIACADKKVYCYNSEGNSIPGWEFGKTENFVYQPLQHFKIVDKDYIVFSDTLKTYIVDRRGSERVKIKNYWPRNRQSRFFIDYKNSKHDNRLITNAIDGSIVFVYFDGRIEKVNPVSLTSNHCFEYQDVDADGLDDFIFTDEDELMVYKNNGKLLFKVDFDENISQRPVYYQFPNNRRKIGIVVENLDKIYLVNSDGSLHKGFPLKGSTLFSIGHFIPSSDMFNLIVGSRDGFLYNYEVY